MAEIAPLAKEPSVDRVIAFSDGVVAIAITLLILPLTDIEARPGATVGQVIGENQPALLAFGLSFWVIANYWTIHHNMFAPVRHHSPGLIGLNMLWLASIVFLPFPTALIADRIDGGFGTLYIGTLLVISVLNLLIANYLVRHPEWCRAALSAGGRALDLAWRVQTAPVRVAASAASAVADGVKSVIDAIPTPW